MGSTTASQQKRLEIWQWNCRGYRRKRSLLQQYINTQLEPPDVIALQEPGVSPTLSGYEAYDSPTEGKAAILVSKALTVIAHDVIPDTHIEHVIVEIVLRRRKKTSKHSLFILNAYSPPRQRHTDFYTLIRGACTLAKGKDLILLGDFNAQDTSWGYRNSDHKGKQIAAAVDTYRLELLTDPTTPTRIGNSVCRDTCPDLTFIRGSSTYTWENLMETLGSDHYIIRTQLTEDALRRPIGKAKITDWDAFRCDSEQTLDANTSLTDWCEQLRRTQDRHTKHITRTTQTPEVDGHLLHLWDARRSLLRRWKTQKHNRKLKVKIALLTTQAEEYAASLAQLNWAQFTDTLKGSLGTARTWRILRALIDPTRSKTETNKAVHRLIHTFDGTDDDLLDQLRRKCFGDHNPPPANTVYQGSPNALLDRPITIEEVYAAVRASTRNTAAGADRITYSLIRNLNDTALQDLTAFLNTHWQNGTIPPEWKHAEVILIPKPGKKLQIENLRPISLTSCLGKLFERVITFRLQTYLEDGNLLPHTMFGFRAHLSTQDVLLQLKEEVIEPVPRYGENVIMALDIKGAFDNVSHPAILEGLAALNCGHRVFNYVKAFLTDRTATVGMGTIRSDTLVVPNKGTPQGSVISPLLFNVAMVGLAHQLQHIEGVRHAMYADDITVWATQGSLGEKEYNLQQAATCVEQYAHARGLACSTEKSELLRVRHSTTQPRQTAQENPIRVLLAGKVVPERSIIRVLGAWLQSNRRATHTLTLLRNTTLQVARMIARVTTRRHGMREEDTLKLVRSLIVSRIVYGLPYHHLNQQERDQIDAMMRRAYRVALKLPPGAPTSKLLAMGVHNTFTELCEAQMATQLQRLTLTPTGRALLQLLGHTGTLREAARLHLVPDHVRSTLTVAPIPRNMDPLLHQGRREARVEALTLRYRENNTTCYTDAALYHTTRTRAVAVVLDHHHRELASASLHCQNITEAEEVAIALAIAQGNKLGRSFHVLTDSQAACRNYLKGRISQPALNILLRAHDAGEQLHIRTPPIRHKIIWTPGHAGLEGNQAADRVARGYTSRAPDHPAPEAPVPVPCDYSSILNYYKGTRRKYSPPHRSLTKEEATSWRLIQAGTYPNLHLLSKIHPTAYPSRCPWCSEKATLFHITWACRAITALPPIQHPSAERWESLLASEALDDQLSLIDRARRAATASGALD